MSKKMDVYLTLLEAMVEVEIEMICVCEHMFTWSSCSTQYDIVHRKVGRDSGWDLFLLLCQDTEVGNGFLLVDHS